MAKRRMNEKDIDQLLAQYRAERRRLNYQLGQVREAIAKLQGSRKSTDEDGDEETPKRRGRKTSAEPAKRRYRRKPGRRKKREVKGGYRLNPWDERVLGLITKTNKLQPKQNLLAHVTAWAKKTEPKLKGAAIEAKLTRTLQKLSGKRGVLGTHRSGLRRGYHYGLKDWFFASTGKLRSSHLDKLVIEDK